MQKWIILIVVCLILIIGTVIVLNVDVETEYVPETEIEDVELRKTIVTLYFSDKETGELSKETRLIDSKQLLKNPYEELISMLTCGPENEKLEKIIPEGAQILDVSYESGLVTINFSKEFTENISEEKVQIAVSSLYKTLTELTEVTGIRVLVEGEEIINDKIENAE
jgi:spore germination protein GerM